MRHERSGSGHDGQLLRREAEVLRQARHPGVVELIDLIDDGTSVVLVTAEPDGPRLTEIRLAPKEVAGITAVLATTLADLHEIGVTHGAVEADRIALDEGGRPVLGGFDRGRLLEGAPGGWPASVEAIADIEALGRMTAALVAGETNDRDAVSIALTRLLGPLTSGSGRPRARGRVTARRLAQDITTGIPEAKLPVTATSTTSSWEPPPRDDPDRGETARFPDAASPIVPARRPVAPLAMVATITIAIVVACHPRPDRPRRAPIKAASGPVAPRSTSSTATTIPTTTAPPRYVGDSVTIGLGRYKVGEPSDVMAFGRWSCSWPMLVIGRPRTGQVWLFRHLPATDEPVEGVEVGRIPGLIGVHAEPAGLCDRLLVDRPESSAVPLDLSSVA